MNLVDCHLCEGKLIALEGFPSLLQVTSDCRPWRGGGQLAVCRGCGAVQKPITEKWLGETSEIYAGYEIYCQGAGTEQLTFDPGTGTNETRSTKIVEWLTAARVLPESGRLLDIGCGNGAFLRAFGARHPRHPRHQGWEMTGLELDGRNQRAIESIPGVTGLHVGPVESLTGRFDLIALIHVLEHVPRPARFLASLTRNLEPDGLLLIEVPDIEQSPFDILIADHCTHFAADALHELLASAGFESLATRADLVPREISQLTRFSGGGGPEQARREGRQHSEREPGNGMEVPNAHIAWLQSLLRQSQLLEGTVGVFGTSIAATWLATSLGDKVVFFVDEDRNRIGRDHLSRPIYAPSCAPKGAPIVVPMRADIAAAIAKRFENLARRFVLPAAVGSVSR
ncbi:MAG: class I SAM-dependent methyltransferase [Pseudomonadota bacterium]